VTVGSRRVAALIDTGSTTSVISSDFEKQIPQTAKKERSIENLNLITACGDPMPKVKTVELQVKLHSVDSDPIKNNFHVVPNLAVSCILGMDFITNLEFRINTASRRISYKNNGKQYHIVAKVSEIQPSMRHYTSKTRRRNKRIDRKNRNQKRRSPKSTGKK
jgi:hypothetical protein